MRQILQLTKINFSLFDSGKLTRQTTMLCLFVFAAFASYAQCSNPMPVIVGDFSVCANQTSTYTVEDFIATNVYTYTLSGGGTIISTTNETIVVEWQDEPGGPFQLSVVEDDGTCSADAFANINVESDPTLVCNDNLNISLSNSCSLTITADVVLESPEFPDDSYIITIVDESGNSVPSTVGANYIGQTLEVTVEHICSGNKCWGNITIEDKLAPVIVCENDTLTCAEYQSYVITEPALVSDNCGDATFERTVEESLLPCGNEFYKLIEVTWIATDASGNSSNTCTEQIYVERVEIDEISAPINYDGLAGNNPTLSCSGNYPLNSQGLPDPTFTGLPGGLFTCSTIDFTYTDVVLPLCDDECAFSNASYKVIRTFVIIDWCTGEIVEQTQIIKVEDKEGPSISNIPDLTTSVNPFDCSAQVLLPIVIAEDNCTVTESLTYTFSSEEGVIINGILYLESPAKTMGPGITVTVVATDCCGNDATDSFNVIIQDNTPPVVVADAHEVISLLPSGIATMMATSIDDGSYDNCGPIEFGAKRMDNGGGNPGTDVFPPAGPDNGQYNDVVHFYCADIPNNPIMVQFRVCDDADMNGVNGTPGDNCNIAMIEVEVQDKFAPVIQCPTNMTISCTEFEGIDLDDENQIAENFGSATAFGTCGVEIEESISGTENLSCGEGVIFRNFTATTSAGSQSCSQSIVVVPFANNLLTCDRITFEGLNNNIYNWCAVNDNNNDDDDDLPSIDVDGCELINFAEVNIFTEGLCTTAGVQRSVDTFNYASSSACKKYIVHYEVIDQCIFDENYVNPITLQIDPFNTDNGYFEFYLEYNVVDTDAPELTCVNQNVEAETCEGFGGTVSIEAVDACTPADQLLYEFRIDVNGNGSVDLPFNGWFSGNSVSGSNFGLSAIPVGTHIILWRVDDGCGNTETCSQSITVTDFDKAPTPYCYGALSTAVMNTNGSVEIWAIDFDNGSEDDCGGPVTITMIPEIDAINSSNPLADSEASWEFDCSYIPNGVAAVLEIRVYVQDETGAFDFCTSTLRVEDNEADFCPDDLTLGMLSGEIKTESGKALADAKVTLNSSQPEYPILDWTDNEGAYSFTSPLYFDYEVSAEENSDYLQGVSTLDIILIQKHILGLEPITSPYSMIAADVNNDCKVTGSDIVQVRKLILGKYDDNSFPSNDSWRFINENQTFIPSTQPCDFSETFNYMNLDDSNENNNFVAVKIADINDSSIPGFTGDDVVTRSDIGLKFVIDNMSYDAGEVLKIPVTASNFDNLAGFQFGLQMDNMMINGYERASLNITRSHVGMMEAEEGIMYFSFNEDALLSIDSDEVLFYILATTTERGELVDNISITSSNKLVGEAYIGEDLKTTYVEILVRSGAEIIVTDAYFTLMQNQPNPFSEMTNIRFELPKSGYASLKIFDLQGRMLFAKSAAFAKGYNVITVSKDDIGVSGELFYQLEFDGKIQTKKMILIQ